MNVFRFNGKEVKHEDFNNFYEAVNSLVKEYRNENFYITVAESDLITEQEVKDIMNDKKKGLYPVYVLFSNDENLDVITHEATGFLGNM